jgi:aryl-alcohol dehydrogenase-like predicted oxidoreductase
LKTDRIDLYFLHRFDDMTCLEETLRALDDLVTQGKILYTGASNFAAWQVAKSLGISSKEGWSRFACIQPMYNLVKRQAEVEILPMAQSEHVGVIAYNSMGGGLLTGKYGPSRRPATGRLVDNKEYVARYGEAWMYDVAEEFTSLAESFGYRPAALAVAWVIGHPSMTAALIGARNPAQLDDSLGAVDIAMTPELRHQVSSLTPEPPPATDRNDERTIFSEWIR